jgi:hypothetical protein
MSNNGYVTIGCLKCLACWDWEKGALPDQNCPACGIATSELNLGSRSLRWTGVVKQLSDKESVLSFHDARTLSAHADGCRVCKGRRARRLSSQLNSLMRGRDVKGARALISKDTEAAPLAVMYAKEEYRHLLETILSQEYGITTRPERQDEHQR